MKLPAELRPERITALIDTREQAPLDLAPLNAEQATLHTGDYSLAGLEHVVRIERKSEGDLIACVGRERERFDREVERLLAFPVRILVVESSWRRLEMGQWRGKVKPNQVIGSLLGWQAAGVSVFLCDDHARAGKMVSRLLFTVARRRWKELRTMATALSGSGVEV